MKEGEKPKTVEEYFATLPPEVRERCQQVRATIRQAAPTATEVISYNMPAFKLGRILAYYAGWKSHIGFYPPVSGDEQLIKEAGPYANEKGNLLFPHDQSLPLDLIRRIVLHRVALSARGKK